MASENSNPIRDLTNDPSVEIREVTIVETNEELAVAYGYPAHRDPAYRPWVIAAQPKKPTPYEEILAIMARNVDRAVVASRISLILAIIIAADFLLPKKQFKAEVTGYHVSHSGTYQMQFSDGSVINVSKKTVRILKGKEMMVDRSIFFGVPYRITDKENNSRPVEISIYGNFIFGPIVLLLTSLVGVLRKKGVEFRFNLGVSSAVLSFLNIAFLFIHKF